MNVFKKKTPPAVQAAAAAPADAVQKALKDNETKDLVDAMTLEHGAVQSDAEHLEIQRKYQQRLGLLRQGQKDDGLIGTLLSTQEDKVQDAQIALNRSMGRLTHKSLALLVENTSVIGLHGTQQAHMQEQQNLLLRNTDAISAQHQKLLEQNEALKQQQRSIQTAHQGLLEAKGITHEHAQQLVGCVSQVTEAGQKLALANRQLRTDLEQKVQAAVKQCLDQLRTGFSDLDERLHSFESATESVLQAQTQNTTQQLTRFHEESGAFQASLEHKLQAQIHAVLDQTTARHTLLVEQRLQDLTAFLQQKTLALNNSVHGIEQAMDASLQAQTLALKTQRNTVESSLQNLAVDLNANVDAVNALDSNLQNNKDAVGALEHQIKTLQAQHHAARLQHRKEVALVAFVALVSLGWQIARHFALG